MLDDKRINGIIDSLNIPKQENALTKDLEWNDKVTYEVPNVVGKAIISIG